MSNLDEKLKDDIPQPMESLYEISPPPFLTKTYDLVDDSDTNNIVSWSGGNNSFIVWDPQTLAINLLPKYFKHNNFSSFVRQLNTYGFRKVDPDQWEFAHEGFLRGQRNLLKSIKRKKSSSQSNIQPSNHGLMESCVEVGRFGLDAEIDRLRCNKQLLMVELMKLKEQEQNTNSYLNTMEQRLKGSELKTQKTMSFLAKAMKNPTFFTMIMKEKDQRKELEDAFSQNKRKKIDDGSSNFGVPEMRNKSCIFDNVGIQEYGDITGNNDGAELEKLELSMQESWINMEEQNLHEYEGLEKQYSDENSVDERFAEDLMNEGVEDESGIITFEFGVEGELGFDIF